jgi:SulP family sulfate permease
VAGFTFAAAVIITASQVPAALGTAASAANPLAAAAVALTDPQALSPVAVLLAAGVVAVVLLARRVHPLAPGALVATAGAVLVARVPGVELDLVGDVPSGLPELSLDLPWTAVPALLLPALVIALVGFAEPASIARRYASADRSPWDPDRELVGQGLANLGAGLFGGFAVGGSFSRSALNRLSGARTRWSGVVSGVVVLALLPFASMLSGLPTAALAGLVIASVVELLSPRVVLRTWRYSRPQLVIAVVTVAVALVAAPAVQWGVVAGVVLALGLHLWRELRLDIDMWVEHDLLHVRPQGVLYFGSAPTLETRILAVLADQRRLQRVEIHLQRLGRIDLTGALVLRAICRDLARAEVPVVLSGVQPQCRGLLDRATTRATSVASSTRARLSSSRTRSAGSSGGPASPSGSSAASLAATGANTSRPWNVAETGSSRQLEAEMSTASTMPPKRSAAGISRPLSGPTRYRSSSAVSSATARRRAPTSGSTTARCTPAGV